MTYVVANLHGAMEKYTALLEKIGFSDRDILYVLGDTADYGEEAVALLTELSMCENVYSVAGEHDYKALRMLGGFDRMLKDGSAPTPEFAAEMMAWAADGGQATLEGFRALDADMREGLLDYLSEATLFEEVEAGGKEFVLCHGGIAGFDPETPLEDYEPEAFFAETPTGAAFFPDRTLVVGHMPTASGRIEREAGVIRIDCGVKDGGVLGCLCLETGEEFYV
ncbi:MAG: metallophosphoesterase [Clostridia bacterium]|nr:metallophosphoesterase [Clostridia bacterium]